MSEKRKVAVVYHFFAHYRAAVIAELLRSPVHEYLLVADAKDVDQAVLECDIPDKNRFVLTPCKYVGPLMLQKGLLRLALRRDLQAIVYLGNVAWPVTWLSALIARCTGKQVLFWTHGWIRNESGIKGFVRDTFYRLAHGLLLYGHVAKAIGISHNFSPDRLHVVYNSLDYDAQRTARSKVTLERIRTIREELFGTADVPVVICTSRLTAVRRLDLLLDAIHFLQLKTHPLKLLLVGDGPERESLSAHAARLGIAVHFYGACYDEARLAELTMAANVCVAPGKVGLTAMHSLAFGTPVLTHNDADNQMPEWEAIVPGYSGDFFRKDDSLDLARVLEKWTTQALPDESIRSQCSEIIERFYNPVFQRIAIDRAVSGLPADDLFWQKSSSTCDSTERLRTPHGPSVEHP